MEHPSSSGNAFPFGTGFFPFSNAQDDKRNQPRTQQQKDAGFRNLGICNLPMNICWGKFFKIQDSSIERPLPLAHGMGVS
jgi:hypothetical protein